MTTDQLNILVRASGASQVRNELQQCSTSTLAFKASIVALMGACAAFTKSALKLASDLEEVQNVVDVTFGDMSESVNKFSKNAIQNKAVYDELVEKVDKVSGKGLSSNDFTNAEKSKLEAIETGANRTIIDSELSASSTNPVENKIVKSALDAKANTSDLTGKADASTVTALSARMDTFTNLAEGSTTGDAELADGRVGADGTTYNNIGSAIRGQVTDIKTSIIAIDTNLATRYPVVANASFSGDYGAMADGTSSNRIRTDNIALKKGDRVYIDAHGLKHGVGIWNTSIKRSNLIRNDTITLTGNETIDISEDGFICVVFANSNSTAISLSDFKGEVTVFPEYGRKSEIDNLSVSLTPDNIEQSNVSWKKGYLSSSNGAEVSQDSGSYYINVGYLLCDGIAKLISNCTSDYVCKVMVYDENYTCLRSEYNYRGGEKTWESIDAKYFKIGIKKTDESVIEPDYINDNVVITKVPFMKDLYNRSDIADYPIDSVDIKNLVSIDSDIARYNAVFNDCGESIESFVFFSDPHIYMSAAYYPKMFAAIQKAFNCSPADYVVCGGDWLTDGDTRAAACNKLAYIDGVSKYLFRDKYLVAIGNHDTNYQGVDGEETANAGRLTDATINALWYKKYSHNYFIFEGVHTTYFVLDTGTDWETTLTEYRITQLEWLCESLKTKSGNLAILMHIYNNLDVTTPFALEVKKIITAYNSRGFYEISEYLADFTSAKGTIKFVLTGHEHKDFSDTVSGVPVIAIQNTFKNNAISFDMIFVDYDNNKLECVRSGDGSDREFILP